MNFNQFFTDNLQYILPGVVGLGVGLVILMFFTRSRRRTTLAAAEQKTSGTKSSQWIATTQSLSERRNSVRREGPPVKVILTSPAFKTGTNSGFVLDRSTGGLRIAMKAGMAPGSTMQVRAKHAPETTPWVTVIVRNCKDTGEHYELGCEFEKTPPWNVLLLFG